MKTTDSTSSSKKKSTGLCCAIALSALYLSQAPAHADETVRPIVKPRAAATITPGEWSSPLDENDHELTCTDSVMVGRKHKGDENGETWHKCATVQQFELLKPKDPTWSSDQDEEDHRYTCPENTVMTGRKHSGDENGSTQYQCAAIDDAWGNTLQVVPGDWEDIEDESDSVYQCPPDRVLTGRHHHGDENGKSKYLCATLW